MSPLFRSLLAEIRQRPARLLLTGLAVLVAAAFGAGAVLLDDSVGGDGTIAQILGLFVAIAMGTAAVVVSNTFRIVLAQRRRQIALLRCTGASQAQVLWLLLAEAVLAGLLAGLAGIGLAIGVGYLVPAFLPGTATLAVVPAHLAVVMVITTVVTVLAAAGSAATAAEVPPIAALSDTGSAEVVDPLSLRNRLVIAALGAGAAVLLTLSQLDTDVQRDAFLRLVQLIGAGALMFGVLMLTGARVFPRLAGLLGIPLRRSGRTSAVLAVANLQRAPRRTAAIGTMLCLGVLMISCLLVMVASGRESMVSGLRAEFPATAQIINVDAEQPVDPAIVQRLPAGTSSAAVTSIFGEVAGHGQNIQGVDLSRYPRADRTRMAEGTMGDFRPGTVLLGRKQADAMKVGVGDRLNLAVHGKRADFTVAAIHRGSMSLGGVVLFPQDPRALAPQAQVSSILLDSAVPLAGLQAAVGPGVEVTEAPDQLLTKTTDQTLDLVNKIIAALLGMTLVVAVTGVSVTLILSVVERRRESGLLRALGLDRAGLRAVLAWESVLLGSVGLLLGGALGTVLGLFGARAWGIDATDFVIPLSQLASLGLGVLVLAVLAALVPAALAGRTGPMQALSPE
ncbi:FtsX-like permease family protein [Pseudonocardiaceae bacterium YIM PH 21723]|nr:FtsX-like permease family protein [Pseudonocardiaceae bacterium YIM PH 21723]